MCCGKETYEEVKEGRVGLTRRKVLKAMGAGAGLVALGGLTGCTSLLESRVWTPSESTAKITTASATSSIEIHRDDRSLLTRVANPQGEFFALDLSFKSDGSELSIKYRINKHRLFAQFQLPEGGMLKGTAHVEGGLQNLVRPKIKIVSPSISDLRDKDKLVDMYEELIEFIGEERLLSIENALEVGEEQFTLPKPKKEDLSEAKRGKAPNDAKLQKVAQRLEQEGNTPFSQAMTQLSEFLTDEVVQEIIQGLGSNAIKSQSVNHPDIVVCEPRGTSPNPECSSGGGSGSSGGSTSRGTFLDDPCVQCLASALSLVAAVLTPGISFWWLLGWNITVVSTSYNCGRCAAGG